MDKSILENIIIIIPSLDPDEKLMQVVNGMINEGFERIVLVNDGSDKDHLGPFEEARALPQCTVLGYEVNQGKGHALKTAFKYIYESFPDCAGVITVDGDNQHTPEDTARIAAKMKEEPKKVIMGCRNFKLAGVPTHNMLGNRITSLVFRLLCGIKLSDTQTGLRGIPFECLKPFFEKVEGERFEYETNMLLYMKTAGIELTEVSIATIYIEENKTSHFNPFKDSVKIYMPILKFSLGSSLSLILDLLLFTVLVKVFSALPDAKQLFIATAGARVFSSLFNFAFNRKLVFKSDGSAGKSMVRYYILAVCQMCLSWLMVTGLVSLLSATGLAKTGCKLIVDFILFLITFQIQREWVFKE